MLFYGDKRINQRRNSYELDASEAKAVWPYGCQCCDAGTLPHLLSGCRISVIAFEVAVVTNELRSSTLGVKVTSTRLRCIRLPQA